MSASAKNLKIDKMLKLGRVALGLAWSNDCWMELSRTVHFSVSVETGEKGGLIFSFVCWRLCIILAYANKRKLDMRYPL